MVTSRWRKSERELGVFATVQLPRPQCHFPGPRLHQGARVASAGTGMGVRRSNPTKRTSSTATLVPAGDSGSARRACLHHLQMRLTTTHGTPQALPGFQRKDCNSCPFCVLIFDSSLTDKLAWRGPSKGGQVLAGCHFQAKRLSSPLHRLPHGGVDHCATRSDPRCCQTQAPHQNPRRFMGRV